MTLVADAIAESRASGGYAVDLDPVDYASARQALLDMCSGSRGDSYWGRGWHVRLSQRSAIEAEERSVTWTVQPGALRYGPGLTEREVVSQASRHMRSGYWRGGSSSYHDIEATPDTSPGPLWRALYGECR